jgi:hypothetical protein
MIFGKLLMYRITQNNNLAYCGPNIFRILYSTLYSRVLNNFVYFTGRHDRKFSVIKISFIGFHCDTNVTIFVNVNQRGVAEVLSCFSATYNLPPASMNYSSIQKMKVAYSSETSISVYRGTRCYITEESSFRNQFLFLRKF